MGVPVRVTLGRPPHWFRHKLEHVRELAPPGYVFNIKDEQTWRRKYRHHLYRVTAERLQQRFEEIAHRHPGQRLVLLCFESDPAGCHRRMFAEWWQERTGQHVEELRGGGEERRDEQERLFDL
jgi:hypothetical protein